VEADLRVVYDLEIEALRPDNKNLIIR